MPDLKARDTQTGEVVSFRWNAPDPPTEADMADVFAAHRARKGAQPPAGATRNENMRADGTAKGKGFLGVLGRPDGKVSTEISIGVNLGGKEVEIPTLVPTLSPDEIKFLTSYDGDASGMPGSIVDKAVAHARQRIAAGKSPFAADGEQRQAQKPSLWQQVVDATAGAATEAPRLQNEGTRTITGAYLDKGPMRVARGVRDIARGNVSRGANQVIEGAGVTALPAAVPMLGAATIAAPVATGVQLLAGGVGAMAGSAIAEGGAEMMGADEDQARLAGNIGGLAGGTAGVKLSEAVPKIAQWWQSARRSKNGVEGMRALRQAAPATASAPYRDADMEKALPELLAAHGNAPITSVAEAESAANAAIAGIEAQVKANIQQHATEVVKPNWSTARAAIAKGPKADFAAKGEASVLAKYPQLQKPLTLAEADAVRADINAEMQGVLKRNRYDQALARKVDPEFAAMEATAKALRDAVYSKLQALGVPDAQALRQREVALIGVRNAFARAARFNGGEKPVAGSTNAGPVRQAVDTALEWLPVPGVPAGVTNRVRGIVAPKRSTRDELVARAFSLLRPAPPAVAPVASHVAPVAAAVQGARSAWAPAMTPALAAEDSR